MLMSVRYVLSQRDPFNDPSLSQPGTQPRILFIESGARALSEKIIGAFYARWPGIPVDLVTCYGGLPEGFAPDTTVYRVTDYSNPEARQQLFRTLRARGYAVAIVICSGEPIMTKWKWMLALRVPAKFLIVNENCDYFWLNREHSHIGRTFVLVRLGLHGAGAFRTIMRLLLFPFSLLFLLLYAFVAHARRRVRLAFKA